MTREAAAISIALGIFALIALLALYWQDMIALFGF